MHTFCAKPLDKKTDSSTVWVSDADDAGSVFLGTSYGYSSMLNLRDFLWLFLGTSYGYS